MASRNAKNAKNSAAPNLSADFFAAVAEIEKEKNIPRQYMYDKITQAMITAYKRDNAEAGDNVNVELVEAENRIEMYVLKDVVEEVEDPVTQISLEQAQQISKHARLDTTVKIPVETKKFGRIAAQAAKQVIIQGIREAERGMVLEEFTSKQHEILTGVVHRIDPHTGAVTLKINSNSEYTEAVLPSVEQIEGETLQEGDLLKVYVVEVRNGVKGPQVLISRTHPGLLKRLFELEVQDIASGEVEIKSIAREAGKRSKMAVASASPEIDPVGACIGVHGDRVEAVARELNGEKIDVIRYSDNIEEYVAAALSPAKVTSVTQLSEGKSCRVIVPDDQLSLAIGKLGQNARLAAKLTGYKIDIKPESEAETEEA